MDLVPNEMEKILSNNDKNSYLIAFMMVATKWEHGCVKSK
jgi:hypothetical protein